MGKTVLACAACLAAMAAFFAAPAHADSTDDLLKSLKDKGMRPYEVPIGVAASYAAMRQHRRWPGGRRTTEREHCHALATKIGFQRVTGDKFCSREHHPPA
jgi:hypothetical protein